MRRSGRYFNVRTPAEEFECPRCGQPIQTCAAEDRGTLADWSRAWHDEALGGAYCGRRCAALEAERVAIEDEHERRAANAVHP